MKKIYLDLNAISHIKDKEVTGLYDFIIKNLNHFVFVYSPAHFDDLMRSYKEDGSNEYFDEDLNRLDSICETHLMRFDEKKNSVGIYKCSPKEFFETERINYSIFKDVFNLDSFIQSQDDDFGLFSFVQDSLKTIEIGKSIDIPFIGSFSNAWEFLDCVLTFIYKLFSDEAFYRNYRSSITKDLKEGDIARINDKSPEDVINAINDFFNKYGVDKDVKKLIRDALPDDKKDNHKSFFQNLYVMLDLMRYRSDKRPMANIMADADHAYYGSYCDVLVTNDNRMQWKTQAVYACLGIQTKIISKEELMQYLKEEIINEFRIEEPLKEILSNQHIPEKYNEEDVYMKWTTLDHPFFGYFDKLEYQLNLSSGQSRFVFTNQLKYTYFTEADKLFEILKGVFHEPAFIDAFEKEYIAKFKADDKTTIFSFYMGSKLRMVLAMEEERDFLIPVLYMYYDTSISAS